MFPGGMQKVPLHPDRAHPLPAHAGPPRARARGRARPTALGDAAAPVHARPPATLRFVSGFLPSFVFSSGSFLGSCVELPLLGFVALHSSSSLMQRRGNKEKDLLRLHGYNS